MSFDINDRVCSNRSVQGMTKGTVYTVVGVIRRSFGITTYMLAESNNHMSFSVVNAHILVSKVEDDGEACR